MNIPAACLDQKIAHPLRVLPTMTPPAGARTWDRRNWQQGDRRHQAFEDESDFQYASVTADEAGQELFSYLVLLKLSGVLSAKQACVLAFWAHKSGATGGVKDLALAPDTQSGKFSRRFDRPAREFGLALPSMKAPKGISFRWRLARKILILRASNS